MCKSYFRQLAMAAFFGLSILFGVGTVTPSFAQPAPAAVQAQAFEAGPADLIVKGGTGNGTYDVLFDQMAKVCTTPSLQKTASKGTLEALDDIMNNRANLAFVPLDVLYGKKLIEQDPLIDNIRVFMPLYNAELHIIARRMDPNVNGFMDLGNKRVGAFGSGYITSRILLGKAGLRPISLQNYDSEQAALNALTRNEIDAVFIVVGQPATWATKLDGKTYKLLPFDRFDIATRAGGYSQSTLRYMNLSSTAVKTVSVTVNLITYNYDSKKKVNDLSMLKKCLSENISDLRETTGNHPKWREINPNATSDWPMFKTTATAAPAAAKKRK